MKRCNSCGAANDDGDNFCRSCGARLDSSGVAKSSDKNLIDIFRESSVSIKITMIVVAIFLFL
uniref:zinc ribbon domain-containing protein n=1 Tax=Methanobrevibacter sp. TaxID=66852 RepID=UPI00388F0A40